MGTTRAPTLALRAALLAALAAAGVAAAQQPAPKGAKAELFPGAKLLQKLPYQVYRVPELVTTEKGTRLLVWVDAYDPNPPPSNDVSSPTFHGRVPPPKF